MKLTVFTNYALRTLMFAAMREAQFTRVQEIADAFGISRSHLVKCVHQLGTWGYLENVRGRGGGFRLSKPANQITVGEIVRLTEDTLELVECFNSTTNRCPLIEACRLSRAFKRAFQSFIDELDTITIADITANSAQLQPLFFQPETTTPSGTEDEGEGLGDVEGDSGASDGDPSDGAASAGAMI